MNKILTQGTMVLLAFLLLSFIYSSDKSAATAEQREGIYIFMLSKPAAEYQHLGSIEKKGIVMSGKPEEMLNTMLRKAKKDYPQCDGIIFTNVDMYKADCVKFK